MKFCKNCKWHRCGNEMRVSSDFIDGIRYHKLKNGKKIRMPGSTYVSEVVGEVAPFIICQHSICFKKSKIVKPMEEGFLIERVKGPAQLNENNNCKFYKRKWWKFWVKD